MKVSLLLSRRWFYHAVSVFLQSVLLLVVAYTTFYYRVDNFQDRMMVTITCMSVQRGTICVIQLIHLQACCGKRPVKCGREHSQNFIL